MKKYLIVLAAAVVALASCKPGEESKSKYTSLRFKQTTLEMAVGESAKLNVLYEPTTLEAPVCEWASSNAEVATVDQNGNVKAIGVGEANITAKNGDLTAACQVIVKSVYGAYTIEDYGLFGKEPQSWVEGSDTIFDLSKWAGGSFNCRLGYWLALAWDGNVTYVSGTGWQGKGYLLYSQVPFYTIDDPAAGEYNGTPFSWGSYAYKDTKGQIINNVGEAGRLDKDIWSQYIDTYIQALMAQDGSLINKDLFDQAVGGAMIFVADHSGEEPSWDIDYGLISAVVKDMTILWDNETETFSYKADIDWLNNLEEDRFYGLKYTEEGGAVKPYDLSVISEHYELDYAELAPASEPKMITKRYDEVPVFHFNRELKATDKLYKK